MTLVTPAPAAQPVIVDSEGGPVTLEPLDELTERRDQMIARARDLDAHAAHLISDAASKARDGAGFLVAQRSLWDTAALGAQLAEIDTVSQRIDQIDGQLGAISGRARRGFSGFFERFGDRQNRVGLIKQRDQLAAQVASTLLAIGERAPERTIPDADALLVRARQEREEATALTAQSSEAQGTIKGMNDEIGRRNDAIGKLGFDALWTAAWLKGNEPAPIESPLTLKRGELAWICVGAILSRQTTRTQWTGSSQGLSFPIGHTGIRYRVGSFRGHPIQTSLIKDLGTGSLVLTNQRLVFIGQVKSVTIALSHIVHVEAYTDALAMFQDKKEAPDFFKLQAPQYVLFYLNYALSRQS